MPTIDRIPTLQYMGSKSRMLEEICTPIINSPEIHQVVDLFAGTGSVGYALSPYKKIISNDIEYYVNHPDESMPPELVEELMIPDDYNPGMDYVPGPY